MALVQPTLSSLITRIRRYLREPTASKSHWDDNDLKQFFNINYRLRCSELYMAYEGNFVNVRIRDLVADQDRYSWPPNFQKLSKLELVRTDGRRRPLRRFERHEEVVFDNTVGGDDSYIPTFRPVGSGFELEPGPEETVTNGLRIEYFGIPVELEADSDTLHPDFPQLYDELLVLDTVISALTSEQIMETQGLLRTIERERERWTEKWERFIENRMTSLQQVRAFVAGYRDA